MRSMVESRLLKGVRDTVSEFSENTSIHGVRYITENDRNWIERLLWIVTEAVCMVCAVYLMVSLLDRFRANPTMTRVDPDVPDSTQVPFPAVTLCNVNRIFYSKAKLLVDRLVMPNGYLLSKMDVYGLLPLLGHLLAESELPDNTKGRDRLQRILSYNNLTAAQALDQLGQPCEELLVRCGWEGREVDCRSVFQKRISYLGFCCAFNSGVNSPYGLSPDKLAPEAPKPLTSSFYGYPLGLTVLLDLRTDDYFWGPFMSGGVLCSVHDNTEIATEQAGSALIASQQEVMVQVEPSIRSASASIRSLDALRRRCLLPDDPQQPHFLQGSLRAAYSYENCILECKRKDLLRACGCQPLHFPSTDAHVSAGRRCDLSDLPCLIRFEEKENMNRAEQRYQQSNPRDPDQAEHNSELLFRACGCLSQCSAISYDIEITNGDFDAYKWVRRPFYHDLNMSSTLTLVHVYFGKQTASGFVNDLANDPIKLMASLGGIFSLFLGCSFMSVVELLYFFTVRLWLVLRRPRLPPLALAHALQRSPGSPSRPGQPGQQGPARSYNKDPYSSSLFAEPSSKQPVRLQFF